MARLTILATPIVVCVRVCVVAIDFGIRNFARRSIELYWR